MPSLVNPKERAALLPHVTSIVCPSCNAAVGAPCVYRNNARRGGDYHFTRFYAVKKARASNTAARYISDNAPLASRRLTIREERDLGIWKPLRDSTKENGGD